MRTLLLAIPLIISCASGNEPKSESTSLTQNNHRLSGIIVDENRDPEIDASYDRDEWNHWIDADDDCQDARQEVLIRSGVAIVYTSDHCDVSTGSWEDPYTSKTFTLPGDLDVDHLVPLKDAHVSGGYQWSAAEKKAYANDLSIGHLLAVDDGSNQAKGDKSPDEWMPTNAAYHCTYVAYWVDVKKNYNLSMTRAEFDFINTTLDGCDSNSTRDTTTGGTTDTNTDTDTGGTTCCKVCKTSQACGDACISKSYTCNKPAGCACQG